MTSHEDIQRAVDAVTTEVGYVGFLICNAGMTTFDSSPDARPKPHPRDPRFRPKELQTNVAAVFMMTVAFLELLDLGNRRRDPLAPTS